MKKVEILKALGEAGTPLTLEELSKSTGLDIARLRVDLYRLVEEGEVEQRQRGNLPVWTTKVRSGPGQHVAEFKKYL